jgi:pyruvate dehydrogenase E1 component
MQMLRPSEIDPMVDVDAGETAEWMESLEDVLLRHGPERVNYLLQKLKDKATRHGVHVPLAHTTDYVNTIAPEDQPRYPGDREMERRIKSIIRWNAMVMVVKGNKESDGIGGHIATYASSASLYEVGFNHFFRGREHATGGDFVYVQGHASPGIYARAFLEGRLSEKHLKHFRRELAEGGGLSSYPHPWLMPDFWEFPTVSMGLGPLGAIYQARFLRYLEHRGLKDTSQQKVWCFIGDGECDEVDTLGAITLATREKLDNLIFVINCNLQRLDGPVRGNGKIIQELEGLFRGAGWNVNKVVWGSEWDSLLKADSSGALRQRMMDVVDGEYQKYVVEPGSYVREKFFGASPELRMMVDHISDDNLRRLKRGGHDPEKVYAAFRQASDNVGTPTVILAKTVKGYGLGDAAEGLNIAHQRKKLEEDHILGFRNRFAIPLSDEEALKLPFFKPADDSPEMQYLKARRAELGGFVPSRKDRKPVYSVPARTSFADLYKDSGTREGSTTMAFNRTLGVLLKDKEVAKYCVPIIPDETRTFGMEDLFRQIGIYASTGQLYEPVDRTEYSYYRESRDGQVLQEGINEAGAMCSFLAAGTAYANHGVPMVPFYIYYSMFGFQRVGDLIWAAADSRCKGFLLGATAGRTTLNGEGLQHEDGHSHLIASTVPNLVTYDPAFAYEVAIIIQDGLRRMYGEHEDIFYYITLYNEAHVMPAMPAGCEEGIVKGLYKFRSQEAAGPATQARPQLFGSGPILKQALRAQELLATKFNVSSDVWSVTSYKELRREALACERWNLLHPGDAPRISYLEKTLKGIAGPFISVSDNMKLVAEQIGRWMPGRFTVLGTDGFGRSESRQELRRHFEIDAEHTAFAALVSLVRDGKLAASVIPAAVKELGINPDKIDPVVA